MPQDQIIPARRSTLAIAAGANLTAHLLVAAGFAGWQSTDPRTAPESSLNAESNRTPLGIARGSQVSVSWIGFQTPTEHSATSAEFEQAAFTRAAGTDGGGGTPGQSQSGDQAASAQAETAPAAPTANADAPIARSISPSRPEPSASGQQSEESGDSPGKPGSADQPDAQPLSGEVSEKESPATSVDPVLDFRPGKPLAREGLEINTVLPEFSVLTRITAGGVRREPIVTIRFGRNGKVVRATFKNGTLSGNPDLDEPIRNAIYSWTAKGEEIEAIPRTPRTAGVDVTIRLKF